MTLEYLPLIMLRAFALTLAIECAVAYVMGCRSGRSQRTVVLVNLLTNPLLVSVGAAVSYWAGQQYLAIATMFMEIAAVITEAFFYKRERSIEINPLLLSLVCNAASFAAGEILNRFIF